MPNIKVALIQVTENVNAAATAGTNTLNGTVVPQEQSQVITSITALNFTSACTRITILIRKDNGQEIKVASRINPAAGEAVTFAGELVLEKLDRIRAYLTGCVLNDDIHLDIAGYRTRQVHPTAAN